MFLDFFRRIFKKKVEVYEERDYLDFVLILYSPDGEGGYSFTFNYPENFSESEVFEYLTDALHSLETFFFSDQEVVEKVKIANKKKSERGSSNLKLVKGKSKSKV